jgi:hypothetical protein
MLQETAKLPFDDVATDLPDHSRAEFFRILHETGISQNDVELVRLLKALQLYKVYYESIPTAVQAAAAEIDRLKQGIEQISKEARESLDAGAQLVRQVTLEAGKIHQEITGINSHVDDAIRVSIERLSDQMADCLTAGIEKSLAPLENRLAQLTGSNQGFDDAIARNIRATAALQKNTAIAHRLHFWTYLICNFAIACSLFFAAWFYLHRWYEAQIDAEREALVNQVEKNRGVLQELAKAHRTLELRQDPKHPNRGFLVMNDATGWQSPKKQGVLEFHK